VNFAKLSRRLRPVQHKTKLKDYSKLLHLVNLRFISEERKREKTKQLNRTRYLHSSCLSLRSFSSVSIFVLTRTSVLKLSGKLSYKVSFLNRRGGGTGSSSVGGSGLKTKQKLKLVKDASKVFL
jgi:hypothetical protein